MKTFKILAIALLSLSIYSCTDDDDDSVTPDIIITPNEEELITTVEIHLNDTNNVIIDTISFNDPDGDGGNAPTIDTLRLQAGQDYKVNLMFLDASNPSDIEDITLEIEEEDDEHLVCFDQTNLTGLSITKTDSDGTYVVGLKSKWVLTPAASSTNGVLKLTLKHQPDVKDGTCAPGDTDVEINFPVIIN
jgi:hypothetical protein